MEAKAEIKLEVTLDKFKQGIKQWMVQGTRY